MKYGTSLGQDIKKHIEIFCNERLIGKMLCGREDIYRTLYFSGYKDIVKKYRFKLPGSIALGEVYGLCLKIVNGEIGGIKL